MGFHIQENKDIFQTLGLLFKRNFLTDICKINETIPRNNTIDPAAVMKL